MSLRTVFVWFFQYTKELLGIDRVKVIHSIHFKDRMKNEVKITRGQKMSLEDGESTPEYEVSEIYAEGNRVGIHAGKFISHFEAAEISTILFEDYDEREWCRQRLLRILAEAKKHDLINPLDANSMIDSLQEKQ